MFARDTIVAWVTKQNTFMGQVIESGANTTIIRVISTAKGKKHDGKKMAVFNKYLRIMKNGKAII